MKIQKVNNCWKFFLYKRFKKKISEWESLRVFSRRGRTNTKSFAVNSGSRLRSIDHRIILVNRVVGINYVFIEVEPDFFSSEAGYFNLCKLRGNVIKRTLMNWSWREVRDQSMYIFEKCLKKIVVKFNQLNRINS